MINQVDQQTFVILVTFYVFLCKHTRHWCAATSSQQNGSPTRLSLFRCGIQVTFRTWQMRSGRSKPQIGLVTLDKNRTAIWLSFNDERWKRLLWSYFLCRIAICFTCFMLYISLVMNRCHCLGQVNVNKRRPSPTISPFLASVLFIQFADTKRLYPD